MLLETSDESETIATSQAKDTTEEVQETVVLKFIDLYYEQQDTGPVIHLFARDKDQQRWHIEVSGFDPYFMVHRDINNNLFNSLNSDHRVKEVEFEDNDDLNGNGLWRVTVYDPHDIRKLKDEFDDPIEADVDFDSRFLIDTGIKQSFSVPKSAKNNSIHWKEITPVEEDIDVTPRVCYFDIEVEQTDGGPSVVSKEGTELALNQITAISAFDNYSEEYNLWILQNPQWTQGTVEEVSDIDDVTLFSDEKNLLEDFVKYVRDYEFDILTAWNAPFDVPYLVNRCLKEVGVYSILDWSPTRDVNTMDGDGKWYNSDLKGKMIFDLLVGVKKTQIHEMKSYSLANVADELLDIDKLSIDIDDAWENAPEKFIKYSLRDTEAVVEIDKEIGILAYEGRN